MSGRPTIVDLHIAGIGAARLVRTDGSRLLYRAPHETRGHDVDVEILLGSRGEAARERFALEQPALARLAGVEGVVPLLEAGVTVDGDLYLMTPALGGRTLTEIIATEGPVPWREATRIIEAAAATLHHAHVVGVTHRRIDPDAIVVTDDGRVFVSGLGSAGLTMDAAGSTLSAAERPGYSAPEYSGASFAEAGGTAVAESADAAPLSTVAESRQPGAAGDIYGLGATLWALLAGRRPFTTAEDDEPAAIVERAATQQVGDLRSVVPTSVAEAVEWATAIEPERRPSSAATFARALREAATRAPSGFISDTAAVVAGWPRLSDADEFGEPDQVTTVGRNDRDPAPDTFDSGLAAGQPDPRAGSDDGRRAGLLVGLGIAAIAFVALGASAALLALVGDPDPVTISGPSIEPGEIEVPAEVLGIEVEAEQEADPDRLTEGTDGDGDTDDGETPGEDANDPTGQSAPIEPFAIPTPTPAGAGLQPAPSGANAVPAPTQPPAEPGATPTPRPRPTPTPATTISAPPPPLPRPAATPTSQTIISVPPAPTSDPTPTIAPAPGPTAEPPTATPAPPTPTPDLVEVIDNPN